jgi:cytidine deaminase
LESLEALLAAARAVRERAHAPYSRFKVGAALLDEVGRIHAGAIAAMVAAGGKRIVSVVVVGEGAQPCTPCGGCRQKLREFTRDDTPVIVADLQQVRGRFTLGELLPHGFGPEHLK